MVQSNEWKLNRESVFVPVQIADTVQEQSVELDYVLPDYYPDFFRLLHCTADAAVTSWQHSDGGLQYTLRVRLQVLYCSEQTAAVQSVTQQLEYTKQLPLESAGVGCDPANLRVQLSAEPAYLNCRAVNHRRIDLRGAVRIRAQVHGEQRREVLRCAEGLHVQCRKEPVTFVSQILRTSKRFTLSEEIRIAPTQPPLLSVLRDRIRLTVTETRIVAGKLIVKGEAAVDLYYTAEDGIETLRAALPFSQIVEQDGLTDQMPCAVTAELADHLMTSEAESDGDIRLLHCDLQICLHCEAVQTASADLVTDLYSTVHPCEIRQESVPLLAAPTAVCENMHIKAVLSQPDAVLTRVFAAWAEPENLQSVPNPDGAGSVLSGTLHCCVIAADAENHMLMLEQNEPFTWVLEQIAAGQCLPPPSVQSCSYTLTGSDSITLQAELQICGQIMQQQTYTLLTDAVVSAEERLPQTDDYALRLYFGQPQEALWEIAKRYHTAVEAIREENDCPADRLTQAQMLLIPIVK